MAAHTDLIQCSVWPGWTQAQLSTPCDLIKSDRSTAARDSAGQASLVSQFMTIQYLIFSCLISALKTGFQHQAAALVFCCLIISPI